MYPNRYIFIISGNRDNAIVLSMGQGGVSYATSRRLHKRRDCCVIHYVLRGSGWFDGIRVGSGQGFYISPGEYHDYYSSEDDPWEYVFMDISPQFANRFVWPYICADAQGIFSFSFKDWLQKWADANMGTKRLSFISETEAAYNALSILRHHTAENPPHADRQQVYVQKAQMFIETYLSLPLTVFEVANAVNLNPRYLYKLFMQYTGVGIKEYITDHKMQMAKELLERTGLSVKEIALNVGIKDPNSFSKLFKLMVGMSPSAYRKNIQNLPVTN